MVQMTKVAEREARGSPPCDHGSHDREYYLGSHTGDDACLNCGAAWPSGESPPAPQKPSDRA
jgi:hypothetical protein